ncbi:hypothetical protein GCM10027054_30080 [Isoptericola nanjingensis]
MPKRVWRIEPAKLEEHIERQYAAARDALSKGQVAPEDDEEEVSRAPPGRRTWLRCRV